MTIEYDNITRLIKTKTPEDKIKSKFFSWNDIFFVRFIFALYGDKESINKIYYYRTTHDWFLIWFTTN